MSHIATRQQFSRNLTSAWVLLVADVAVAFLLTPFIITSLGAATYGVWALMIGVIGYMGLIDVGIRGSVGRYINHYLALEDWRAVSEVVGTANVVLSGLSLVVLSTSVPLSVSFFWLFPKTPPDLADAVRFCLPLLAFGLWLSFLTSILSNLLAAREALYLTNRYSLYLLALRTGAVVWALKAGYGIQGLAFVTVATSTLGLVATWCAVRQLFGNRTPHLVLYSTERLREMWRFGLASFATRTSATMANDSAPLIGMWLLGPEAVAIYSVALTLTQYGRRFVEQAGTAIFPSVMKAGAIRDFAGLREVHLRFMDVCFALGSLVYIGMMVFSHSFLGLWLGPQYEEGAVVVGILVFGFLMQGFASTAPLTLASLDRVSLTMKIGMGEAIACIVLTAALPAVFGMGLAGMALGATVPRLVTNCLLYPWLAVSVMGPELRTNMWPAIGHNLLRCTLVASVFFAVSLAIPSTTWTAFVLSVAAVTLLHLSALGHLYQVVWARTLHDRVQAGFQRLSKGRRA